MKYDNCKDCQSRCVHAGKDREFVCINGQSCKVTAPKPKTNADRIRSMSDEELAYWVMCPYDEPMCGGEPASGDCMKCCLQWLQQPAEG